MRIAALAAISLAAVACKTTAGSSDAGSTPTMRAAAAAATGMCGEVVASLPLSRETSVGVGAVGADTLWVPATVGAKHGVVRMPRDLSRSEWIEIGTANGDEPPPEVALAGDHIIVAAHVGKKPRKLALFTLAAAGAATPLETFVVDDDESYAFDLAFDPKSGRGVVVWDGEVDRNGVIVAKSIGTERDAGAERLVLSEKSENAEAPRILAVDDGFFVAWIVERALAERDGGSSSLERPGELPVHRSLHGVHLDARGAPSGGIVRFGTAGGEIATFELAREGGKPLLFAVERRVRQGTAATRLVRFSLEGDPPKPREDELVGANVGGAGISALEATPRDAGTLAALFLDDRERAMLAPPGGPGRPEARLDGARPIASAGRTLYVARARTADGGADTTALRIEQTTCLP